MVAIGVTVVIGPSTSVSTTRLVVWTTNRPRINATSSNKNMDLLNTYGSSDEEEEPPQRSKVLKLASVLPQHILNRLTKGSDDDSEDEDDSNEEPKRNGSAIQVSSLLNDLTDMKPKHSSTSMQWSPFDPNGISMPKSSAANTSRNEDSETNSKLGEAFLRPKITIETKTSAKSAVVDIHGQQEMAQSKTTSHFVNMKRPIIQAAPPVRSSPTSRLETTSTNVIPNAVDDASRKTNAPQFKSKKSRQNLERELRRGNVSAVQGVAVDGVKPTDHTPTVVDYEAMTTIRNVPTTMYDPGSGQAKQAKVSKSRNQIHFLVHQAAELERRRAEQGPSRPSHRADAKRKYGF